MMSIEDNKRLTQVGPDTPMGNLLRRYWMPIAISDQVKDRPVNRRLLGEDLVVYRDTEGRVGIVERYCPHRRADMSLGVPECNGIRCGYHGWSYDKEGKCIEQPAEPRLNPRIRIKAYPAEELGGLVFAYLGPKPAPLLPNFDLYVWDDVVRDIGHAVLDFNWLQAMENSVDPHHVEWLHGRFMNFWRSTEGTDKVELITKKHLKVGFDPFEYGIIKRRVLEGSSEEDDDWKIGHPLVFPHMLRVGGGGVHQFQLRVPIDDTHTWHIWYTAYKPEGVDVPNQEDIPSYDVPLFDENGERILDFIDGQDIFAWAGQGKIADRTRENLASSDKGVIMYRKMLRDQIDLIDAGQDPLGTVRDPDQNDCIELPMEKNKYADGAKFRNELLNFQAIRHSPIKSDVIDLFSKTNQ